MLGKFAHRDASPLCKTAHRRVALVGPHQTRFFMGKECVDLKLSMEIVQNLDCLASFYNQMPAALSQCLIQVFKAFHQESELTSRQLWLCPKLRLDDVKRDDRVITCASRHQWRMVSQS